MCIWKEKRLKEKELRRAKRAKHTDKNQEEEGEFGAVTLKTGDDEDNENQNDDDEDEYQSDDE